MLLEELGYDEHFREQFRQLGNEGLIPARIAQEQKGIYFIYCDQGESMARISGRFRHQAKDRDDFPAIGDWVAVDPQPKGREMIIHALLPRKSKFSRKAVLSGGMPDTGGRTGEQIMAANIDTVFLVSGLDQDFNIRRIERFMTIAWDSGADPVIILNKADLYDDPESAIQDVQASLFDVPVMAVSALENTGIDDLRSCLGLGRTAVFLGSSGVGKSTIINALLGYDRQKTKAVREFKDRGRHTTSYREMIMLPGGGLIIDTPGIREIQPWTDDQGIGRTFQDVKDLARHCRFKDCRHGGEPGCAVQDAIQRGLLSKDRLESYKKLQKELQYLDDRRHEKGRQGHKAQWEKQVSRFSREWKKHSDKT